MGHALTVATASNNQGRTETTTEFALTMNRNWSALQFDDDLAPDCYDGPS